jgi:glutathione synthase/RimK-type ligase-like ATP-grasp enzyme
VRPKVYPKEIEKLAIKATHAYGWEFGGVDIMFDGKKAFVSEVNFPCNFVRAQNVLKQDIALEMVKYLQKKAKRIK